MRTSEELRSAIEERFGFFPPFFVPALEVPVVLENLWQQTLAGYVENPLPAIFKEKLFAYLSRYCAVPYSIVCHSCALRPLGMKAGEVLKLLEQPAPEGHELLERDLAILAAHAGPLERWPEPGSPLEEALVAVAVAAFLGRSKTQAVGRELRRLLAADSYQYLTVFLGYVKACHLWVEAHPELCYEADQRAREHLGLLVGEDPRLGEFFGTYRERVRAELEDRQRSEREAELREHLAAIVASSEEGILTTTPEGTVTSWNPGAEQLYGYASQEIIRHPVWTIAAPDRVAEVQEAFGRLRAGERVAYESVQVRKDGTPIEVWITASPIWDSAGRVVAASAIVRDITEHKRAERVLRESEGRTRLILDTAYEAFIAIDVQGRILEWNVEAERVFAWTRQEVLGRVLGDIIVPERYRNAHVRGLEHYCATGEGALLGRRVEIEALRRDGSEFPVELTISPTGLNERVVFNAFLRDITERKQAEEALRAAKAAAERAWEAAERASRAKSDFLSGMSHELRTPLNAVLGFAQLLQIDDLGPDHAESVEQILRAGRHLLQLIDEVLDMARIEQGRLSLSIEAVHLDEVVREALDLVGPLAAPANIRIWSEASQFDCHALADRQRLKQVLMNLLSNAIKYNREGGTVSVSCAPTHGGRLRIAVADTGPGIPAEMMGRLFLPFERLGAERTSVEGTGIGLSISKRLVTLMGGEIGAESEMGRGSTFWVEFDPATAPEELDLTAEGASKAPGAVGGERTVLYVEDNLSNLRLVERILARRPTVRLVAAMQGGLALELAREHRPDLILLDIHLPDIEGDEVLRRLQAEPATSTIPVITVSAEATPAKIERFLAAGAHAYLTKPLDVHRFLEIIDEVLRESDAVAGGEGRAVHREGDGSQGW